MNWVLDCSLALAWVLPDEMSRRADAAISRDFAITEAVFLCFQIRSLDPARFFDPKTHRPNLAGTMPPARMAEVERALRLVLNL